MSKSKILRKYTFSLLEVVIGLTLAAFLLTSLFSNFRYLMQANLKLQNIRNLIHERSILSFRLNQVWNHLETTKNDFQTKMPQSKQVELHFKYDNGQDLDPNFCHIIKGMLLCDKDNQLCLRLEGKNQTTRDEVLWKKVDSCSFSFFDPDKRTWVQEWSYDSLPPMIKISLGKEEEFLFSLRNASHEFKYL